MNHELECAELYLPPDVQIGADNCSLCDDIRAAYERGAADEREKCALVPEQLLPWYAEDIFPPVGEDETGFSRDRLAAQMARHLLTLVAKEIRTANGKDGSHE